MTEFDELLLLTAKEPTVEKAKNKIYKVIKRSSFLFVYITWIMLIIFLIYLGPQQRIGVVNISGIVNEFVTAQAKSGLSKEDLKKNIQVFGTALEKVMHNISLKKHLVLMPAEAVIVGAKDYTQEVLQALPALPVTKPLPSVEDTRQAPSSQSAEQLQQKMQQFVANVQPKEAIESTKNENG